MFCDFEGKTEEEAREKAIEELGLEDGNFDVEVIDTVKKGLFKKPVVKIRVFYGGEEGKNPESEDNVNFLTKPEKKVLVSENEAEEKILGFVDTLINKMGYEGKVYISFRKDDKLGIDIDSQDSAILIGRKGKNLDAIQLITNVYAGNLNPYLKVVIDSENYRMRHEESIVRNAYKVAEQVKRSGRSRLLEPMNPFERRLVHTALNDLEGIDTKSEGEGLYKQVRIIPVK